MATAERIPRPLSYEDFCALVKDGEKADLIDGVILIARALEAEDIQTRQVKTPLIPSWRFLLTPLRTDFYSILVTSFRKNIKTVLLLRFMASLRNYKKDIL